jgi:hypothetical protein
VHSAGNDGATGIGGLATEEIGPTFRGRDDGRPDDGKKPGGIKGGTTEPTVDVVDDDDAIV